MKPVERVLAVLRLEEPDRVPHFEWEHHPKIVKALTHDGDYFDLIEELDIDAVMVAPKYRFEELGNSLIRDEWGAIRQQSEEGGAIVVDDMPRIRNIEDLEAWQTPDPEDPFRYEMIEAAVDRFGGERAIFLQIRDVWSSPRDYLGYVQLFYELIDQPDLVEGIVEKTTAHYIRIVQRAAEIGVDVVMSGDDIADNKGPLLSPKMWEHLFVPHFKKLVDAIHKADLYYWKHSDGNLYSLLDSIIGAGVDGIDPVDPLGGMELDVVKGKYGQSVAIKGNVDQIELLTKGSPEEIREAVKTCIRDAGVGGGYVCSTSNMVHSGVDPERYRVMVEAIQEYGQYPLDRELLTEG
jgi:uroporphyrinogen decarboxylase